MSKIKHKKEIRGGKMEISFLVKIATDEEKAETYLREKGVLKTFTECPYCGNKHFGKVRRGTINATNVKENGAQGKVVYLKDQGYHMGNFYSY